VLSAAAALRSGAGLVSIAAMPESLSRIGALSSAEVMVDGIHDGADLTAMLRKKSIVVAGMGLKDDERAREYIKMLLETPLPLVLDAGALKIIKELQNEMKARQQSTVLTPHAGELAALLDISGEEVYDAPIDCAKQAAERFHSIVVLKMNKTIITDGMHRTMISDNKNKGMATAGSGDVLSGIIAANIAASSDVFHRVCMGVHLHAVAGRYAAKVNGQRYMNAGDIIIGLKEAQQELFEG
jgi:NAD(P)H-hydrate epimerase